MKTTSPCIIVVALSAAFAASSAAQEPRLTNLSVRTLIDGAGPAIIGFTLGPSESATVVLRAVGPSLAPFGVDNPLADPRLEVFNAAGNRVATNDDYAPTDTTAFAAAGAFPLRAGGKDAAIVATLPAGSYTAHVAGPAGARGEVLVEAYLAAGGSARLQNLSVRAAVRAEDGLIAGFTVAPGVGQRRLLMRAIGPTLGEFGVAGVASDPRVEVFSGANRVTENDNWASDLAPGGTDWSTMTSAFLASGAFPLSRISRDAAVLRDFEAGSHTIVARANGAAGAGIALLEIYETPSAPLGSRPL